MMKGIRTVAATFLLEAMVLLAAGATWQGSWSQRMYGTGIADVWELFGTHTNVTKEAWDQGWRVLQPLTSNEYNNEDNQGYISRTLYERSPRLLVMETPNKIWSASVTYTALNGTNSDRQNFKRLRELLNHS